jgi:OOP family OmpA-OmpF porin
MKKLIILLFLAVLVSVNTKSQIVFLDSNVNSTYLDYRPIVSANGNTLYFTVERHPKNKFKDGQDIWMSELKNGEWSKAVRLPKHINSERFNSVFWTSFDGNRILIRGSREGSKNDYMRRGLSIVTRRNGAWGVPEPIKIAGYEEVTQGKFTTATLSGDEKVMILAFSSEEKGEWLDLWISRLIDSTGEYTKPVKFALSEDKVDETNPYIGPDDKTLYYASTKKGGLGNFDIWMSRRLDSTWGKWTSPINLGKPINTKKADTYFSISENDSIAYIATNATYGIPDEKGGFDIGIVYLTEEVRPDYVGKIIIPDTLIIHDTVTITSICNPLDTMSAEQLTQELAKHKILFDFGSSVLREDAYKKLDIIIALMQKNPNIKIELGGHSDALGDSKKNQKQSEERAMSTKGYLLSRGVDESKVIIKGYSNTEPVGDNTTDFGRQLNRRVDIKIFE